MNRTLCAVALAVCTALACDGQVDTHYRGEPLMRLSGDVIADGPLANDLAPAFVFRKQVGGDGEWNPVRLPAGTQTNVFMRGQVTGTFPTAFTMTLFDPPPASVLSPYVRGEVLGAVGEFVAVPPDHPVELTGRSLPSQNGSENERVQLCADTGDCIEREFPCPPDPSSDGSFPCGPRIPDRPAWETWGYSINHRLLYLAEPAPAGSYTARFFGDGSELAAGYHLLAADPPITSLEPPPLTPEGEACSAEREREYRARLRQEGIDSATDLAGSSDLFTRVRIDHPCSFDFKMKATAQTRSVNLTLTTAPWDPWLFF